MDLLTARVNSSRICIVQLRQLAFICSAIANINDVYLNLHNDQLVLGEIASFDEIDYLKFIRPMIPTIRG